jgi:hypothetical protein
MPFTVRDIVMDADRFRQAYPNWPSAEPEREPAPEPEASSEAEAEAG